MYYNLAKRNTFVKWIKPKPKKGATGDELYVILHGAFVIHRDRLLPPITLSGRGIFVGEIASLYSSKRTAGITSPGYTEALVLSTAVVYGLMFLNPPFSGIHDFFLRTAVSRMEGMSDVTLAEANLPTRDLWTHSESLGRLIPPIRSMRHTQLIAS